MRLRHSGSSSIVLAEEAALQPHDPEPTCKIELVAVDFEYQPAGHGAAVTHLTVRGLAWGVDEIRAEVRGVGGTVASGTAEVGEDRGWSVELDLAEMPLGYGETVAVTASGHSTEDDGEDQECEPSAAVQVTLGPAGPGPAGVLVPADGCPAGFEAVRSGFVAGHPDRLIRSRSFVPLLCSFSSLTVSDRTVLARMVTRTGVPREVAFKLVGEFARRMAEVGREFEERIAGVEQGNEAAQLRAVGGIGSLADAIENAFAEAVVGGARRTDHGGEPVKGDAVDGDDDGRAVAPRPAIGDVDYGIVVPPHPEVEPIDPRTVFYGYQGATATVEGTPIGVKGGISKYVNLGWLGILFYDRLRFRASGLVAGDQVYSLSLAPGEEVTLTQRSETKRSRSFEEVIDRTTERELEFSSTWSTDVTQSDASSETTTVGGNLGVSVDIPVEPVEIGVNAGVSAQDANTISQSRQRTRTQEVTTRVTAKAREQHKTTFKVGTDVTEEFGSKRVLRNANPSRALTLNVYKLYQKYRVLLERYDAKLCFSLGLYDPGRDLRAELEQELAKLDPKVPPGVCPELPAGDSVSQSQVIENRNAEDVGGDEFGRALFTTVLPAGTVLSGWSFQITSWTIEDGGTERPVDVAEFTKSGGDWWFIDQANKPEIGSASSQSHQIEVLMPEAWGPGWWTVRVTGTFTWTFVPSEAMSQEVRTCLDAERKKIRDSFSPERVLQILDEVRAGARELILKRLFEEVLLPGYYPQGINPPIGVLERLRNYFDWNEAVIEYLPWWMTASGRQQRNLLRQQLLGLPGETRSDLIIDDLLVASAARVYLPLKRGAEHDAVAFVVKVGTYDVSPLKKCISDFVGWREANWGALQYPLPTAEQVIAPGPAVGTPAGASAWQHDWEKPRRRFIVLDEWSDLLPTDGVHLEPSVSTCGANDEYRASALVSDLRSAAAMREVEEARAKLERDLGEREDLQATIVLGDPTLRFPG
jgi:hypothetical protein